MIELTRKSSLLKQAWELFETSIAKGELLQESLTEEAFTEKVFLNQEKLSCIGLASPGGEGFAFGCTDFAQKKNFITLVMVKEEERKKGIGTALLNALEERLLKEQETGGEVWNSKCEISFFNPCTFSWKIPGKQANHPNMPGVDMTSGVSTFFEKAGYHVFAVQNSYYLSLKDYESSEIIAKKKQELEKEGIVFVSYDNKSQTGMKEMLASFQNPLWEKEILSEPGKEEGGRNILVPVKEGRVCGFTGPLDVEKSGRGYFAGIAVDEGVRGKGVAKVLFCELCTGLKNEGASFMTLFTGEQNPARKIYEAAGFQIVKSWADMRKE